MNEETDSVPAAKAYDAPKRRLGRFKAKFVNSEGKSTKPELGLIFERSIEERARLCLKRPGLFVVSKEELLKAIIAERAEAN